ncbi:MAG: OPT family oligopeptide transporter [Myxococcaceae bacterium]
MSDGAVRSPFVPPEASPPELTVRALLLGSVLGVLFAASSVYLAVKVGMTVSASIPIAVLSIAVFRALGKSHILENTIVQTTGSAGESLAFGIAAALPALLFLGYDIELGYAFLVAGLGGLLGVLMMIPLRHGLIVQEHGKLSYPEGTACADVLTAGERGGTTAKTVIAGFIIGGAYKLGYAGLRLWREVIAFPLSWIRPDGSRAGYEGGSIALEGSPELLGVGYIIGPKIAGIQFAGGVLSYLILIPAIKLFGGGLDVPLFSPSGRLIRDMTPDQVRNAYVLYIGAGAVATGGLISLVRSLPTLLGAFRRGLQNFLASRGPASATVLPRTERDLPLPIVLVGIPLIVLVAWLLPPLSLNLLSALLIAVFAFFFVTVSARITGEIGSSANPISGMIVATLLATCFLFLGLGWTTPPDRLMALTLAAIVGIAASNGGTTAQDLKTAFLVGGTPYRQQLALFVGVLTSAAFIGGTLVLLNSGGTKTIPEQHADVRLTPESSSAARTQVVVPIVLDNARLAQAKLDVDGLRAALWKRGVELHDATTPVTLRAWDSLPQNIASLSLDTPSGEVSMASLGALGAPHEEKLRIAFAHGDAPIPPGKYWVNAQGAVTHVVDPGIGGRISQYAGETFTRYDAPKARLFSLVIDGILTRKLPWGLVLIGVFIALMLELCGVAALPFAVGVYLPISTSTPIFVGGVLRALVDRRRGSQESDFSPGTLMSSGYIAGGAIAGVLVAMLAIPASGRWLQVFNLPEHLGAGGFLGQFFRTVGEGANSTTWAANLWATAAFCLLVGLLARTAWRQAR